MYVYGWKIQDLSPHNIHGYTPYHIAALNGHEKNCNLLMNLTDTNPKDNSGRTPLDLAALNGRLDVCRLLMETAKTYVEKNQMDDFLRIPLQWAALKGHAEIVELFMDNLRQKEWQKTLVLSFETDDLLLFNSSIPVEFLQSRKLYPTLLLNAIQGGSLKVIELFVEEYKLDVNQSDDFGMTPLHLASKLGKFEICKFLSKYVLDKNTLDNDGQTPYDLAVSENKWDTASFLFGFSLKGHWSWRVLDKNTLDNDTKIDELQAENKQILESVKELQPVNVNVNQGEIQNSLNVKKMLDSKLSALENQMKVCITGQTSG